MQILTKYKGGSLGANALTADAILSPKDAYVLSREFFSRTDANYTLTGGPTVNIAATGTESEMGLMTTATNATPAVYAVASPHPVALPRAGRTIAYECRVSIDNISTATAAFFVGLSNAIGTIPVTTAGVANAKCVGFVFDQAQIRGVCFGTTAGSVTLTTAAAVNTRYRLGFVMRDLTNIDFWFEGTYVGTVSTGTAMPDVILYEQYGQTTTAAKGCAVDYLHLTCSR